MVGKTRQIDNRVEVGIVRGVRDFLLIHSTDCFSVRSIMELLDLSEEQVQHICASIQSVMELRGSDPDSWRVHFYHASFLDFMQDPARSKEFTIHGDFLIERRRQRLEWLHQVCSRSTGTIFSGTAYLIL